MYRFWIHENPVEVEVRERKLHDYTLDRVHSIQEKLFYFQCRGKKLYPREVK